MPLLALLALPVISSSSLSVRLKEIEAGSKGALGVGVVTANSTTFLRRGERFSLQSVMKMVVAMAALDRVDQGRWNRDHVFTFRRADLSLSHQPLADKLGSRPAMPVTLAECIDLMVTQSCSASADFVIRKLGGTSVVNAFLRKNGIRGMSVDRQERELQTNVVGLTWKPEYVDARRLELATRRQSQGQREAAYRRYQADPRDTTTPEAMTDLLHKLLQGKLLSRSSTEYLIKVMEGTDTGPGRLKAGIPSGWTLGHKTGTSSTYRGVACATNDVGFARQPSGEWVILVALLRNSTLTPEDRDAVLCKVARAAFAK